MGITRQRVHQLLTGYHSPTPQRLSRHGLNFKSYRRLLDKQQNRCAICGVQFSDEIDPCIDHCHETRKVRGLLCRKCNVDLAVLEKNGYLEAAKKYLAA